MSSQLPGPLTHCPPPAVVFQFIILTLIFCIPPLKCEPIEIRVFILFFLLSEGGFWGLYFFTNIIAYVTQCLHIDKSSVNIC